MTTETCEQYDARQHKDWIKIKQDTQIIVNAVHGCTRAIESRSKYIRNILDGVELDGQNREYIGIAFDQILKLTKALKEIGTPTDWEDNK